MSVRNAAVFVSGVMLALQSVSYAQTGDFPNKPIRMIVASTAGGPLDLAGRLVAEWWQKRLGQPVVVEARPGGNNMIAFDAVLKSPPDGYTLLVTSNTIGSQHLYLKNPSYHPMRDVAPIAGIVKAGVFWGVPAAHPIKNIAELIAWMKANPGKLNFGEAGSTATAMEEFVTRHGLEMTRVRYKGGAPLAAALMSGEIDLAYVSADGLRGSGGKIRALAYSDLRRHSVLNDIPTISETVPGFGEAFWFGIVGPAGIPSAIAGKLNAEVAELLKTPDAIAWIRKQGREPMPVTIEELRREIEQVMKRHEPLVARGIIVPQ